MSDIQVKAQDPRIAFQAAWVLWAGLLAAVLGYGAIGYFLQHARSLPGPAPEAVSLLRLIFGGIALSETALIFLLPRLLPSAGAQTLNLVRWLVAESIAVYGLVLFVLGAPWTLFGAFLAWAVVLLAIHMPRD